MSLIQLTVVVESSQAATPFAKKQFVWENLQCIITQS